MLYNVIVIIYYSTHLKGPEGGGGAEETEDVCQVPLSGLDHRQTVSLVVTFLCGVRECVCVCGEGGVGVQKGR